MDLKKQDLGKYNLHIDSKGIHSFNNYKGLADHGLIPDQPKLPMYPPSLWHEKQEIRKQVDRWLGIHDHDNVTISYR